MAEGLRRSHSEASKYPVCQVCPRVFSSREALILHYKTDKFHYWCQRCQEVFDSEEGRLRHQEYSPKHHICYRCKPNLDFVTKDRWDNHQEYAHHYCPICCIYHDSWKELQEHDVAHHRLCVECRIYFKTPEKFNKHKTWHEQKEKMTGCPGCASQFLTFSGMLLHLESGFCGSRIDLNEIQSVAFEYHNCWMYTTEMDAIYPYVCHHCEVEFARLSVLFRHLESWSECSENLQLADHMSQLQEYLVNRLVPRPVD